MRITFLKIPELTFFDGTIFLNWSSVNSVWPGPTLSLNTCSSHWMFSLVRDPSWLKEGHAR